MEFSSWFSIAVSCLVLISLAIITKLHFRRPNPNLPPGPKPWPIIGNLNLISELPHQSLHNLSKKYGPIMRLKFGSFHVVVASSSEMAEQFLKTHDHVFATRPQTASGKHTCYDHSNVTWAPYGPQWRLGRKIYLTKLFSSKGLESYHEIRAQERHAFMSRLFAVSGKPVVLKDHLFHFTLSVISRIVMGKKYFSESKVEDDEEFVVSREGFQEMLEELFLLNGVFNIGDWIPWLGFLDLQGYVKRMKDLRKRFDRFYKHVIDDHMARRTQIGFVPNDFLDFLLGLVKDPSLEVDFTLNGVKAFALDQMAGGTDTAATTVEWAMSELMKNPNILKKANEEIDRVVGRGRWVEESDIPNLPYLNAIIKETLRLHPVAVLLAPHMALEDCKVEGYDIKKGTMLYVNAWSISRDPSIWECPAEFCPERFLGEKKEIDFKGQNFEFLPFGSGRRMCPGYKLGLKMVSSGLANLLHGFNWRLADQNMKPQDLDMEELFGLATVRKFPLVALAEPRLPQYLFN
ncbi:flavonoid 3'-monooxygenase-like [Neltuma alba]|uniref:flavonoid 3'-monooxygenase-like n=1 Tax=Neltuma alba TaxID=207710 RepID=UPI0010A440DB|nr:flavonoid 3'-monooxygenase-like [Prosopis alba]